MQTLLALGALLLVMLLSVTMYRGMAGTHQRMLVNEVATQLTGVGEEVLGRISSFPFDRAVVNGRVSNESELTDESNFGNASCNYHRAEQTCQAVEDFDGADFYIARVFDTYRDGYTQRDSLVFHVRIDVSYVNPLNPNTRSTGRSFAKEVYVEITNPNLKASPITAFMSRVVTYDKTRLPD